jgi:hypothetical protein
MKILAHIIGSVFTLLICLGGALIATAGLEWKPMIVGPLLIPLAIIWVLFYIWLLDWVGRKVGL